MFYSLDSDRTVWFNRVVSRREGVLAALGLQTTARQLPGTGRVKHFEGVGHAVGSHVGRDESHFHLGIRCTSVKSLWWVTNLCPKARPHFPYTLKIGRIECVWEVWRNDLNRLGRAIEPDRGTAGHVAAALKTASWKTKFWCRVDEWKERYLINNIYKLLHYQSQDNSASSDL